MRPKAKPGLWFLNAILTAVCTLAFTYLTLRMGPGFSHEWAWVLATCVAAFVGRSIYQHNIRKFRVAFMSWASTQ
jgi:hypothetical protein